MSISALLPLLHRLKASHEKIVGGEVAVLSVDNLSSIVDSFEMIAASLACHGNNHLEKLIHRLEMALAKIVGNAKIPSSNCSGNSMESLTDRLEILTNVLSINSSTDQQYPPSNTPNVAQSSAAAVPVPVVSSSSSVADNKASEEKAKKAHENKLAEEAEKKKKSDEEAAKKKKAEEESNSKAEAEAKAKAAAPRPTPTPSPATTAAPSPKAAAPLVTAALSTATSAASAVSVSGSSQPPTGGFYSVDKLKVPVSQLPAGVVVCSREQWLSDGDFLSTFKMTKVDFAKLAAWKKEDLKKKAGLF